jgi:O-acetylserine/cysteine efflux transporter
MPFSRILLALLVMAVFGFSFAAIKIGLEDIPPLLLCALRFFFSSVPAIFFVPKPRASWKIILGYSLLMFVLMFYLSFFSIDAGITPGLASLLIQLQVFFTMLFAAFFFKEHLSFWHILGLIVAFSGLAVVGKHTEGGMTSLGLVAIIAASICWSFANLISKKAGKINMLSLVIWSSFFAWPILLILSLIFEGPGAFKHLRHAALISWASVIYMAYAATLFGFSVWSWLLSQHRAATVAPFALSVPCFGILGSVLVFHEPLQAWKLGAAALIISGLGINLFGVRLMHFFDNRK